MDTPGTSLASVSLASVPEFLALKSAKSIRHGRMEMLILRNHSETKEEI